LPHKSSAGSLTSLADELSARLARECLPAVFAGGQRIAALASNASSPKAMDELDALAGQRFGNGKVYSFPSSFRALLVDDRQSTLQDSNSYA
jgi:hypothetical protein